MIIDTGMIGLRAHSLNNNLVAMVRVTPTEERTGWTETEEWTGHHNTVGNPSPGQDILNKTQGLQDTAPDAIEDNMYYHNTTNINRANVTVFC